MTTLRHLDLALIDIRDRLTKELQFSADSERQIRSALETVEETIKHQNAKVEEAFNHLTAIIREAFNERQRALETALGTHSPQMETIDYGETHDPVKLAPRKMKIASGGAAE